MSNGRVGTPAIRHDILDFCERELVTLSGGGVEKKMAIIVLGKPRWNHNETANSLEHVSLLKQLSLASVIESDG